MDKKLLEGLNNQINKELFSAYMYFAMSIYFIETTMEGFAKIVKEQAKEELIHAKRIYDYLLLRNEKITLLPVEAPVADWINPIDAIKDALEHEKFVTDSINKLYEAAKTTKDYAAEIFLHWFIEEQVEEESKFKNLKERIEKAQSCECEIIHIDRELKLNKEYLE